MNLWLFAAHTCEISIIKWHWFEFVGYKKVVVSSKPTAASFSFGQKHKHIARFDTDGPGPSAYDVTGLSVKGTLQMDRLLFRFQSIFFAFHQFWVAIFIFKMLQISALLSNCRLRDFFTEDSFFFLLPSFPPFFTFTQTHTMIPSNWIKLAGKATARESTLGSRPLPRKQFQTPAPGEYDIDRLDKSKLQSGGCVRGYTFGHPNTHSRFCRQPGNTHTHVHTFRNAYAESLSTNNPHKNHQIVPHHVL